MKKTTAIIVALLICSEIFAGTAGQKKKVYQGFSGGMMLHLGWLFDRNGSDFAASGLTKGIGGAVKVHLWKHLRVGSEGYVSDMALANDGYIRSGWGGLLAEWWGHAGKFHPYAGMTLGGGSQKNLHIFEGNSHDWQPEGNAVFHKNPFLAVVPYIGCEFNLTDKLRLTLKADWLMAIHKKHLMEPTGPKLYLGFLFGH